jgi:hypothetical protein
MHKTNKLKYNNRESLRVHWVIIMNPKALRINNTHYYF